MAHPNDHDIKVLNGLIAATLDTARTHREAAEDARNPDYRLMFEQRGFEREQMASDLQQAVRALGGDPRIEGSILAKAQRAFSDIRHALMRDDQVVVDAVEQGEDLLTERFERALKDGRIAATTRETIRRIYALVQRRHDEMSALKHSLDGQRDADNPLYPK